MIRFTWLLFDDESFWILTSASATSVSVVVFIKRETATTQLTPTKTIII